MAHIFKAGDRVKCIKGINPYYIGKHGTIIEAQTPWTLFSYLGKQLIYVKWDDHKIWHDRWFSSWDLMPANETEAIGEDDAQV